MLNAIKQFFSDTQALLVPAVFAIAVILVVTDIQSIKIAIAKIMAGLFCAVVFTEPFLDFLQRDPEVYKTATAGIFAMLGHELMRTVSGLNLEKLGDFIKKVRGK